MKMEELLYCYNKGCGIQYKPSENNESSCHHHPGEPIFHDALKGWSCCKKRSTDFTEFLNIPGCTTGFHSNVKPVVEAPPVQKIIEVPEVKETLRKPLQPRARPSDKEPMINLEMEVAESYKQILEKRIVESQNRPTERDTGDVGVAEGTSCKNNGCMVTYKNEGTNDERCIYHSGIPVFHEGMKYWSCCQHKTTDFSNFLNQPGCATGKHVWAKKEDGTKVACRHDWHQTSSHVTLSIFSKSPCPIKTVVKANEVICNVHVVFDQGKNVFQKEIILKGVVDPVKSHVKIMGSKVEINLKKAEPGSWSSLEL